MIITADELKGNIIKVITEKRRKAVYYLVEQANTISKDELRSLLEEIATTTDIDLAKVKLRTWGVPESVSIAKLQFKYGRRK